MNNNNWIKPDISFDPKTFDGQIVLVRATHNSNVKGTLHLDDYDSTNGQIRLRVSFEESPFKDGTRNGSFYLDQEQLESYQARGATCVLMPPPK
jgi:hypothetical protein